MLYSHKVALNIRSCREARGYSQEYMAEMLNICQSSYANLELGKTSLSLERLNEIAKILHIDLYFLLNIEHDISPQVPSSGTPPAKPGDIIIYEQLIGELKSEIAFLRKLLDK